MHHRTMVGKLIPADGINEQKKQKIEKPHDYKQNTRYSTRNTTAREPEHRDNLLITTIYFSTAASRNERNESIFCYSRVIDFADLPIDPSYFLLKKMRKIPKIDCRQKKPEYSLYLVLYQYVVYRNKQYDVLEDLRQIMK